MLGILSRQGHAGAKWILAQAMLDGHAEGWVWESRRHLFAIEPQLLDSLGSRSAQELAPDHSCD
jgi:hypothetical protein